MNRFELNVAVPGKGHFCRIALPETNQAEAINKAVLLRNTLGADFECSLTRWNDVGIAIHLPAWGAPR